MTIDLTEDDIETASEAYSPGGKPQEASGGVRPEMQNTERTQQTMKLVERQKEPSASAEPVSVPVSEPPPVSNLSIMGLDRAKMEAERLARNQKRKAAAGEGQDDASSVGSKRLKTNDENAPITSVAAVNTKVQAAAQRTDGDSLAEQRPTTSSQRRDVPPKKEQGDLPFPKGVVKKTWVKGQRRMGDDIRIEEVLQKDKLEMALISSFQWDQVWLLEVIDELKTRLILVSQTGSEDEVRSGFLL